MQNHLIYFFFFSFSFFLWKEILRRFDFAPLFRWGKSSKFNANPTRHLTCLSLSLSLLTHSISLTFTLLNNMPVSSIRTIVNEVMITLSRVEFIAFTGKTPALSLCLSSHISFCSSRHSYVDLENSRCCYFIVFPISILNIKIRF